MFLLAGLSKSWLLHFEAPWGLKGTDGRTPCSSFPAYCKGLLYKFFGWHKLGVNGSQWIVTDMHNPDNVKSAEIPLKQIPLKCIQLEIIEVSRFSAAFS